MQTTSDNLRLAVHGGCQKQSSLFRLTWHSLCAETPDTAALSEVALVAVNFQAVQQVLRLQRHSSQAQPASFIQPTIFALTYHYNLHVVNMQSALALLPHS